jgi:hypothetical protein
MADNNEEKTSNDENQTSEETGVAQTEESAQTEGPIGIASPEGFLMLSIAVVLDGIGFFIFILGTWFAIDDYGILDIIGAAIIGGWLFMRKGAVSASKTLNRFLVALGFEAVPFLGGVSPSWTILVWKELRS